MTALILAALLAGSPDRWTVTVTTDTGAVLESYAAVTLPVERGSRLVFQVEVPPAKFGTGPTRREVSVPSARAEVREVREKPRPFGKE